jgi:hypothetical protein
LARLAFHMEISYTVRSVDLMRAFFALGECR